MRLLLVLICLLAPARSGADEISWVHPVQTTYAAPCYLCVPAEVNVANPLVVLAPPGTETVAYFAFDLPARPRGQVLASAEFSVKPTQDPDYPNTWKPDVTVNVTDGMVDLGSMLGPSIPEPETEPAVYVGDEARDRWDLTTDIAPHLGNGILILMTAPEGAGATGPRYQCEGNHPGAPIGVLPVLTLTYVPGTATAESSVSRSKTGFVPRD